MGNNLMKSIYGVQVLKLFILFLKMFHMKIKLRNSIRWIEALPLLALRLMIPKAEIT